MQRLLQQLLLLLKFLVDAYGPRGELQDDAYLAAVAEVCAEYVCCDNLLLLARRSKNCCYDGAG